jgi:hypothetical protein
VKAVTAAGSPFAEPHLKGVLTCRHYGGACRIHCMEKERITRERIDQLLRFPPEFDKTAEELKKFEAEWQGIGEPVDKIGIVGMPYPIYPPRVTEFFRLAGKPCWNDYHYEPEHAGNLVQDDGAIATASLDQIKTMLTYCTRGERFCDGHWGSMITGGRIGAILRRIEALRETVE